MLDKGSVVAWKVAFTSTVCRFFSPDRNIGSLTFLYQIFLSWSSTVNEALTQLTSVAEAGQGRWCDASHAMAPAPFVRRFDTAAL